MNKVLARGIMTIAAVNDGKNGQTPHLHIAYANSPDGKVDFSTDDSKDRAYIGQYVSYTDEPDSTDAGMYTWSRIKGNDAVVWHVVFSIRHITDKQDETFRLKVVRIVGDKAEEVDYAAIIAAGADLLIFGDDMGTELRVNPGKDCLTADYPHKRYLRARVVMSGTDITLAQDTIYAEAEDGKPGKDAVTYKLIPLSENALAYFTEKKAKMVDLKLAYKIQKVIGEQVNFITNLIDEGMTLTIQPSVNKSETFNYDYEIDAYRLSASIDYVEIPDNSYTVTLKKGSEIVDQRIVAVTFKPKVVFDIDTQNGEIRSDIKTVDGKVNSFKATIDKTSSTVENLEKQYTQIRQTAKEVAIEQINKTTGRDNLLVGSAFRNENEIKWYNKTDSKLHECRISRTVNCLGTNSVMIESTSTKESYLGVAFYGIKVNAGGKYNLSCQIYKEAGKDTGKVCYEVKCYRKDKSRATVFRPFYNVLSSEDDKWTLNQSDFVIGDDVDYIDVFFWVARAGKFYLACPMLREGEGYTKWSLSQFDYGYVGGNMLDGTKNFNGSHINVNKVSKGSNNGYVTARYSTTVDEYFLSWYYSRGLLKTDTDYVLSFVAKGTGVIGVTIYGGDNKTVFSEGSSGAIIPYDETQYGEQKLRLSDDFRKYWVRIRTSKSFDDATQVGFRTYSGGASIELHSVKLEEGASDTSYTESTEKLVSEDLFMRAGIYLRDGKIVQRANNVVVENNKGEQTFLVDKDGKLNTKLINANEIFAFKVAQPFETYTTEEDLKAGKSLSWTLEGAKDDYGVLAVDESFNGACFNIFNNTERSVSLRIPLIEPFKLCRIFIPSKLMLRAIAVYRKEWDGCRWYMLCPWKNIGNEMYIKSFGITN
ncbi:hypothetical protein [Hallella colorans]|uniref:hypothetical protein n=1 Tax=Hallella colorans TaxID=1703337 RepID=UPI0023F2C455|nr:hypothetical protein [Hallella colorans]